MRKGLSQEGLKAVACLAMLLDHIGYGILYPMYTATASGGTLTSVEQSNGLYGAYFLLRTVGRIAFPIFCFLLVEGFYRTRSRKRYALRLAIGALLAEIPYDLMCYGALHWQQQSVMVTLLLGFGALAAMGRCKSPGLKALTALPFAVAAEVLGADYGWVGVATVLLFEISRYSWRRALIIFCGLLVLGHYAGGAVLWFGNISVPLQAFSALAVLFLMLYDGRKVNAGKAFQWAWYLFYPAHMLAIYLIGQLI